MNPTGLMVHKIYLLLLVLNSKELSKYHYLQQSKNFDPGTFSREEDMNCTDRGLWFGLQSLHLFIKKSIMHKIETCVYKEM